MTSIDKKLLDILVCPLCKGQLIYEQTSADSAGAEGHERLVCRWDRLAYPIKEGIPVLLENESTPWP